MWDNNRLVGVLVPVCSRGALGGSGVGGCGGLCENCIVDVSIFIFLVFVFVE